MERILIRNSRLVVRKTEPDVCQAFYSITKDETTIFLTKEEFREIQGVKE